MLTRNGKADPGFGCAIRATEYYKWERYDNAALCCTLAIKSEVLVCDVRGDLSEGFTLTRLMRDGY